MVGHGQAAQAAVQRAALQPCVEAQRLSPWRVRVVRLGHRVVVVVLRVQALSQTMYTAQGKSAPLNLLIRMARLQAI